MDRLTNAQRVRIEALAVENVYLMVEAGCEKDLPAAIERLAGDNTVLTEMIAEDLARKGRGKEALARIASPHPESYVDYLQAMIPLAEADIAERKARKRK